jgi:hypothetical protein
VEQREFLLEDAGISDIGLVMLYELVLFIIIVVFVLISALIIVVTCEFYIVASFPGKCNYGEGVFSVT